MQLFIPGPVTVSPEVAAAQAQPMIGHRGSDFETLFARIQPKLRQVFATRNRVYISTSSGTGLQEAAVRNCVGRCCLNLVNGAFSERWHEITPANGKEGIKLEAPWGQAIHPEQVEKALAQGGFDAVTVVHNETSTGVMNPLAEIAAVVQRHPDVLLLVDAVSSLGGVAIDCDGPGLDVLLTSSQKCLGLPPGLAFCAVSDRALARARTVPNRGYYFDFLELEKYLLRNQTPATPAISLLFALDVQLDRMLAEGLSARYARHARLAARVQGWAAERYALFAEEGYRSLTVTTVTNTRQIDVRALNRHLRAQGMAISDGYGKLKGQTFRIAHMGDTTEADIERLLTAMDGFK
ncbi:MAG: alanine--glyoxylate aminotransferase family protein [Anaerolineae bacterium]|nr:alanine--glyoxylate aminotransferase family protein [Anaerolineae bacterium]